MKKMAGKEINKATFTPLGSRDIWFLTEIVVLKLGLWDCLENWYSEAWLGGLVTSLFHVLFIAKPSEKEMRGILMLLSDSLHWFAVFDISVNCEMVTLGLVF